MFLWGFCLLHFPDRADFLITKIEGHDKYFEQKFRLFWTHNVQKRHLQIRSEQPLS